MSKCFHIANSITVGTSVVNIGFTTTATAGDEDRFCFRMTESVPSAGATLPVYLTMNGDSTTQLLNKYGNPVLGADLRTRKVYHGWYGATNPHVIITNEPLSCNLAVGNT